MSIVAKINTYEDVTEITLQGRLDGNTMKEVEEQLERLVFQPQQPKVMFILSELDYISSAGLRVMLLSLKRVAAYKGKLVLCELQPNVQDIFKLSGFSTIFTISATREEGLTHLQ